jgi:hypothetical protein
MEWEVELTDDFSHWCDGLTEVERAVLLIGGDKTGNDRWYEEFVPIADALYDRHLEALKKEEK